MNEKTLKKVVLSIAVLASFSTPFMLSAVNIALPSIQKTFGADTIELSWIVTAFLLTTAIFLLPAGKIADIYGRKKIFTYGLIIFTLGTLVAGLSHATWQLIVSRVIQGIGGSMTMTTGAAILISVFPVNQRGKVLGYNVAAVYLGLSAGPFVGGILTQNYGWRSIFFAGIPLLLFAIIVTICSLKVEWADAKGEKFDFSGTLIYAFSLIAFTLGSSFLPDIQGYIALVASIVGILIFSWWERKQEFPVFNISLFTKNQLFAFSNLAALINYCATFEVTFLLSLYLQYIKALTPQEAGIILVAQPIVQTLLSPLAGRLSDKIEPGILATIGMSITALGLLLFIFLTKSTTQIFIIANLVLFGIGFALFSSPNMNTIMSSVDRRFYGIASGTASTMRLVGQMVSMALATIVFKIFIGRNQITPENHEIFITSMRIIFSISTILCLFGIYFSYSRGKLRQN